MKTPKEGEWIVKQAGEHGKRLRVVEYIGETIDGQEIAGGVCEILTSRSSVDNFSDAKEQARARLIAASPKLLKAINGLLQRYVSLVNCGDCGNWNPEDEQVVKDARRAIAKATPQTEGVTP